MDENGKSLLTGFIAGIWLMVFVGFVIWHQPGPTIEQWCETKVMEAEDG